MSSDAQMGAGGLLGARKKHAAHAEKLHAFLVEQRCPQTPFPRRPSSLKTPTPRAPPHVLQKIDHGKWATRPTRQTEPGTRGHGPCGPCPRIPARSACRNLTAHRVEDEVVGEMKSCDSSRIYVRKIDSPRSGDVPLRDCGVAFKRNASHKA